MKYFASLQAATLVLGSAAAFPSYATPLSASSLEARQNNNPFIPAGPTDLRSPCPGTNTLANHGFINRNGVGITAQQYVQGFGNAFGFAPDVVNQGVSNAFSLCQSLTGNTCSTINLTMLATPHAIEHDGSLSRLDKELANNKNADNLDFNQGIWNDALTVFGSKPHIGVILAHTAQVTRYAQAQKADFTGWFSAGNLGGSLTEAAFYLSAFNDPAVHVNLSTPGANPQARMDWINYMFTKEELPTALGWTKPTQSITGAQVASLANAVHTAPTATAAPGTNPFIVAQKKRSIQEDASRAWEADLIKRGVSPAAISSAAAQASALASSAPANPNPYTQEISANDWTQVRNAQASHVSQVQNIYNNLLVQASQAPSS